MTSNSGPSFPVPSETVEAGLLHSCSSIVEWLELSSFSDDDFSAHRNVYRFMGEYLQQYGNLPSQSQLSTRFNWQPPIGDFRYWLTEMKRYSLSRKILSVIQDSYNSISDPNLTLNTMLDSLSTIRSLQNNHIQATDASALERLDRFDTRTDQIFNSTEMVGLRTGMKIIDDTRVGWIPGSMVGVYARPGVGKTWWLLWQGMLNWVDGKRILCIGPEMPSNFLNLRIDVLAGELLSHPIDYNKLLVGDPSIRPNYQLVTEVMAQTKRWWTYDSLDDHPIGLGDITGLIKLHNPDLVLIDGISLLKSNVRGQTWEQMKDLCYGVKNIATINEIPILVTHQAVNSARGRRTETTTIGRGDDFIMPSLNDAAYGDSFVQACSDVITMCGEQTSNHINWYSLRKYRERGWQQPLSPRMGLAVDFAIGKIIDLGQYGFSPAEVGEETRRLLGHI